MSYSKSPGPLGWYITVSPKRIRVRVPGFQPRSFSVKDADRAQKFRDLLCDQIGRDPELHPWQYSKTALGQHVFRTDTTLPVGVSVRRDSKSGHRIYHATWYADSKSVAKAFSVNRYGESVARQLAILARRHKTKSPILDEPPCQD